MSFKMDSTEGAHSSKLYYKKLYCTEHGNKFAFKCDYEHCSHPYVCNAGQCLEGHFHKENQGKLVLAKFDSTGYTKRFNELERILSKQDFAVEAKQLKSFIDELKLSMVSIYKDYKELHSKKDFFLSDITKPFEIGVMEKVDQTITLGHSLRNSIDTLKSKVNMNFQQANSSLAQAEENHIKLSNGAQSPLYSRSQISEKKSIFETSDKIPNQAVKGKEYQQGEVVFQNSPKQTNQQVPIDLEISVEPKSTSNTLRNQIHPSINKMDPFQELFDGFTKNAINVDKIQIKSNTTSPLRETIQHQISGFKSVSIQNLKIYERDFLLKKELTIFLEKKIRNFTWGLCDQVYTSYLPLKPIDKFHQMLQGKRNLLFVFVGDNKIVGSYYPSRYPRLTQKLRNDSNSFMFISNNQKNKILEYKAVPSQFHLSVSDRLYICHGNTPSYGDGIRTFQRNFESLSFCLPSQSYKYSQGEQSNSSQGISLNGTLKVKEFFILQVSEN